MIVYNFYLFDIINTYINYLIIWFNIEFFSYFFGQCILNNIQYSICLLFFNSVQYLGIRVPKQIYVYFNKNIIWYKRLFINKILNIIRKWYGII